MRHQSAMDEITIKVPGPFAGVVELGFSARYPEQSLFHPLRDVPLWIEGPAEPMRRLAARLRMLASLVPAAHAWTEPVTPTDEVPVMAFRDRSGAAQRLAPPAGAVAHAPHLVPPLLVPL